jgi:hypothetical protein
MTELTMLVLTVIAAQILSRLIMRWSRRRSDGRPYARVNVPKDFLR